MAEGRDRGGWNHTAALLATMVNVAPFRGKGRAAKPSDFHPYARPRKREPLRIRDLKGMFGPKPGAKKPPAPLTPIENPYPDGWDAALRDGRYCK